jgi:hypothetical protein
MDMQWLDKIGSDHSFALFLKKTCQIGHDGKKYAFKSDGHIFVAIETLADFPVSDKPVDVVFKDLSTDRVHAISLKALKKWIGPAEWKSKCEECEGTGKIDYCPACERSEDCDECNGTGGNQPSKRYGIFFGVTLDRNLMAQALEGFNDTENVKAHINHWEQVQYVTGDSWIVGCMPVNVKLLDGSQSFSCFYEAL